MKKQLPRCLDTNRTNTMNCGKSTHQSFSLIILTLIALSALPHPTSSLPLIYTVPRYSRECLYDKLEADEFMTLSLFIAHGSPLTAEALIEGPVARMEDDTGKALNTYLTQFGAGKRFGTPVRDNDNYDFVDRTGTLHMQEKVDFENPDSEIDDSVIEEDDDFEGDDDEAIEEQKLRMDEERRRRQIERRAMGLREEGEPYQKTLQVYSPGWYRACVHASFGEVTVELEMRKSTELGMPDETGHVPSYDVSVEVIEERELEVDAAKEEDLAQSKEHVVELHKLLNNIKSKQQKERHRLELHQEINLHSHSRMVLSSLFETALFIGVTGFQVITIRKWFQGGPLLGR